MGEDNMSEVERSLARWCIPGRRFTYEHLTAPKQQAGLHQPLRDLFRTNISSVLSNKCATSLPDQQRQVRGFSMLMSEHLTKAAFSFHHLTEAWPLADASQKDLYKMLSSSDETHLVALADKLNPADPEKKIGKDASFALAKQICQRTSALPSNLPAGLRYHAFEIVHNAVPTRSRESWRGEVTSCPMCGGGTENLAHLHTICPASRTAALTIWQHTPQKSDTAILLSAVPDDFTFRSDISPDDRLTLLLFSLAVWRARRAYASKPFRESFINDAVKSIVSNYKSSRFSLRQKRPAPRDREQERLIFMAQLRTLSKDAYHVYTDGSSFRNPGRAGLGVFGHAHLPPLPRGPPPALINPSSTPVKPYYCSMDIGPKSNNAAELHALMHALAHALDHLLKQNFPAFIKNIRIFIDNQYAIKTTVKEWVAKSNLDLIHQAQTLLCRLKQRFPTHLLWVPGHAQIPGNEIADWLAKRGAQGNSTYDPPPENILHPRPPARPRPVAPPPISADHELADDIPPSDDEQDGPVRPPTSQVPSAPPILGGVCVSVASQPPRRSPRDPKPRFSTLAQGLFFS